MNKIFPFLKGDREENDNIKQCNTTCFTIDREKKIIIRLKGDVPVREGKVLAWRCSSTADKKNKKVIKCKKKLRKVGLVRRHQGVKFKYTAQIFDEQEVAIQALVHPHRIIGVNEEKR